MDLLAAARDALLDAGTARIAHGLRVGAPDGEPDATSRAEGVADLRTARAHLRSAEVECVVDGARELRRYGDDPCFLEDRFAAHQRVGPASLLVVLHPDVRLARDATRIGDAKLGRETVARWSLPLTGPSTPPVFGALREFNRLCDATEAPPDWRAEVEVWTDWCSRPRLVARPQPALPVGALPVPRALREMLGDRFSTPERTVWSTTELWDFGVRIEPIALPEPERVVPKRGDPRNRPRAR